MELTKQQLLKKWEPVLNEESAPKITDAYRREVTAQLLENQEQDMMKQAGITSLNEASPTNSGGTGLALGSAGAGTGDIAGYDPVLISLVRRAAPLMIAYDQQKIASSSRIPSFPQATENSSTVQRKPRNCCSFSSSGHCA